MIITLDPTVSSNNVQDISTFLSSHGWKTSPVKTQSAFRSHQIEIVLWIALLYAVKRVKSGLPCRVLCADFD